MAKRDEMKEESPDAHIDRGRRGFLRKTAQTTAAAGAVAIAGAPFIGNAQAAQTTTWKVQTWRSSPSVPRMWSAISNSSMP